ncbi:Cyclin-L2 [Dermatophagoides pteronyssinus]|uniref:Cyclin-L2 n=1 Tax=Dermatophagoides pteronyssinus TaxID=6956 RepID=A0ABQ8JPI8_DERPT|nr:Cyclin-L2 [Dermatophagoides pteronyssinus]
METKNSSILSVIKNNNDSEKESNDKKIDNSIIDGTIISNKSSSTTDQQLSNNNNNNNNRLKYGRVVILLENPILPKEIISNTPSKADNLADEIENDLRITGCKLIQISGILLRLPQVAMATGQVLFQRFYYSKSFVRQPMEITAMACVVLASKVEEAPRRIRDVINVFHNMKQIRLKQQTIPIILDENYIYLKNQIIKAERRILKELGFCVHVKHPHKFIVAVAQILKNENNVDLIQTAWSYMNDSLQTNVFVRYPPESIACACIHLSSRILRVPLPSQPLWYEMFNVDTESIEDICKSILMLYTRKPMDQEELEAKVEQARQKLDAEKIKARALANQRNINPLLTESISNNSPVLIDSRSNSPSSMIGSKNKSIQDVINDKNPDKIRSQPTEVTDDDGDEKTFTKRARIEKENISEISKKDSMIKDGNDNYNQQQRNDDNVGSEHSSISSSSSFKLQKSPIKSLNNEEEMSKLSDYDHDHYKSYRFKKNGHSNLPQDDYYETKEYRNNDHRSPPPPSLPRSYISSKIVSSNSSSRRYDHKDRRYYDQNDSHSRSRSPISPSKSYCDNQYSSSTSSRHQYYYENRRKNRSNDDDDYDYDDRRYPNESKKSSSSSSHHYHQHQRRHNYRTESPEQSYSSSSRYYHKSSYSGKY